MVVQKIYVDANAKKIMAQLKKQHQMPESGDGREHSRRPWNVVLKLEFELVQDDATLQQKAEVTTHDISQGGFSFIYNKDLPIGTRVKTCFDMLPNKPIVYGEIRGARHLYGMQYRVGVAFVDVSRKQASSKKA